MTMQMRLLAAVVALCVAATSPALAEPAPDVKTQGRGKRVDTYADLHDENTKSNAPRPPSAAGPTDRIVEVFPLCNGFTPNGACKSYPCEGGDREYIRIERDSALNPRDVETFCGLPDQSIQSLAIQEFHTSTVKVSLPTIAPRTTTLANFPNIYWSEVKAYEEPTDITVANVRLKFIPVKYRWNFGDGKTITTTDPGRPHNPELTKTLRDVDKNYKNTHRYADTGTFNTTLTVVFNGQYSVNGGDWTDIAGSIQATSPSHPLTVYEARGELILPHRN